MESTTIPAPPTAPPHALRELYAVSRYGEHQARRLRDQRARELRRSGYTVACKKWGFTDLARDSAYGLRAWIGERPLVW